MMRVGALVRGDDQSALEVLSLARALGGDAAETYLILAAPAAQHAAAGAARAVVLEGIADADPAQLLAAAQALIGAAPPDVLLIPDGPLFEAVGAQLAGSIDRPAARDVGSVAIEDGRLQIVKGAFGGKAEVTLDAGEGAVLGVRQGAHQADELPQAAPQVLEFAQPAPLLSGRRAVRDASGEDLGRAKVIVSGGRGLGSAEAYRSLREVANLLGGALGASRAAVDEGWASPSQQVGITGQKVAPEVYLAIGISGASQHLSGMSGSKVVIAVNRDDKAPIFAAADVGVVADWQALWPELRRALAGG
ncbi:MAG: electron transfer flavoprotein subunit alpha/FixB family protein [Thermaerobacter sp.]|nr:electron transfer flavoprotein subunit alpha/FixB family protein [Thermaerobacter sp.]